MKQKLSFEDTEIAFRNKTNADLNRAYWLFRVININLIAKIGPPLTRFAFTIGLPIKELIKSTIFRHFCGGENIEECRKTIDQLDAGGVGSILDYSVEGEDEEDTFESTCEEIIKTIRHADGDERIPFTVFKCTGLARFALLEKIDAKQPLNAAEQEEFERIKNRIDRICRCAYDLNVRVMIDAEESWIQDTIDALALEMMRRYNQENAIVFNTYQLYRNDKLAALKSDHQKAYKENFFLGAKLVRGAYMEKERERAEEFNYPSPIHPDKASTDKAYDDGIRFCLEQISTISFIAGTHNENSCRLLAEWMNHADIAHQDEHVCFSQLLGMSDHLSFNLAASGYNVAKYVPYGPVKAVMPYLFRRAAENTSVAGQMSRELRLITLEKKRRKLD